MSKPLVTYNATSGELRNNPETFAEKNDYVASIVWEKRRGQNVAIDDVLATIQWGDGSRDPLKAPEGCSGKIQDLNRNIKFEDLEYPPSQFLARIS
jgi:hypothetical protein